MESDGDGQKNREPEGGKQKDIVTLTILKIAALHHWIAPKAKTKAANSRYGSPGRLSLKR